ncbi:HET-domain-containing protein [Fusarium oxysporum f. sp. albedinis]|jgi:hypothetical protein|nr:HET-domain-containing protein [Fusarium oxysporum f. sp. albedinis]
MGAYNPALTPITRFFLFMLSQTIHAGALRNMSTIKPYQINIPDSKIERLKQKLALTDFPADNNQSWERGALVDDVKRLAKTWQTTFDWRAVEASLNKLPHFITSIATEGSGALDVHFIHKKSNKTDAIPLLFLHGWPGSFVEVTRVLEPLVDSNGGPSFHVVAPSLIDFGFSSASKVMTSLNQTVDIAY